MKFPADLNIADYFLYDRLDEGLGDSEAVRFGGMRYSYAEIAGRSRALARALVDAGLSPEQRVYIALPDSPAFVWSIFATLTAGGVLAMGNPAAPADYLKYVVDYSRAAVVIATPDAFDKMAPALARSTHLVAALVVPDVATGDDCEGPVDIPASLEGLPAKAPPGGASRARRSRTIMPLSDAVAAGRESSAAMPATRRDDVCVWLFTSGSTGKPKAAVHTHRDFAFNTEVYAKATVGYRRGDVTASVPRLFFGYATGTNLWFPFAVGATTALFSERPTPEAVAAAIERDRPTVVTNVPTMLGKLLDLDESRPIDMSSVRFHLSAGEALPPALLERFCARFGGEVYDGIGSAEMFHIYASNRPGDVKPGSLGKAVDGYELRVLDRDAVGPGAPELPAGETGVLWVRGDSVALCYHGDRDRSWSTFHGHWCRTGDLFRVDADGYLYFSGRADDLFKVSGIFVAPLEVEECLLSHAAVSLAAVIPVDDEGLTKPKAFVVLRPDRAGDAGDALAAELQEHVKRELSKHKYPRWIEFVDDLPKNDRGKVDRKALAARES
jgi:benzoate-CoA ligase family protein